MAIPTEYTITHACGHVRTLDLSKKPAGERAGYASWSAKKDCFDCYRKNKDDGSDWKEQLRAEAAAAAERDGLPPLTGTDKQVEWATTVRYQLLQGAYAALVETGELDDDAYNDQILTPAVLLDNARWWIDNRDTDSADLPELFADPGTITAGASTENPYAEKATS
jgi:hypothetical protein